jgi:competence protein ComEC
VAAGVRIPSSRQAAEALEHGVRRTESPAAGLLRAHPWHAGAAALAAGLGLSGAPLDLVLLLAAGCAAAMVHLRLPVLAGLAASLLVGGALLGQLRLRAIDAPAARVGDNATLDARGYLLARPRFERFGSSSEVVISSGPLRGARLLARLPRSRAWPAGGRPGVELAMAGVVRRPRNGPRASFDFAAYLRRRGVAGELDLERVRWTGRRRGGLSGLLDRMKARAEGAVGAGLPAGPAALARGMVLGEEQQIPDPVRQDFQASGLAHLLAVSGQNVMLLGALAAPLLAALGLGPRTRAAVLLGLIAVYVPLAGAGPSLQRAGVMGAAGVIALIGTRPSSRSYALLLAAVATLAVNPRACADPGWQLSFAAVAGLIWLGPGLRRPLRGLPGVLAEGVAATLAATLATAPLLAFHFRSVPLAALAANLLALPVVAPIMWLGMVAAALGQLTAVGWPLAAASSTAAAIAGELARPLLGYLAGLAARCAELPGAQLHPPLHDPWAVAAVYAAVAAVALGTRRGARRVEPRTSALAAAWRRLPRRRRGAAVAALAAAVVLAAARALTPPAPPDRLTVSFLDVGQGDATLIQSPDGGAVLFDGGPPEARVARLLRRAGVRRLNIVVATHQSRDHQGGLREVIGRYPVDLLLDGGDGTRDRGFRTLEADADRRGVRRVRAVAPLVLRTGAIRVAVLSPPPRPPGPPPEDPNPRAVVAVVSSGGFELLLSADAESDALAPLDLPDVDAMKVPHHGSADPGLGEVLRRLRPEVAAIEVGAHNPYGHPAGSTLGALRRAHVRTYRTDRDGTVRLTVEGDGMHVATAR